MSHPVPVHVPFLNEREAIIPASFPSQLQSAMGKKILVGFFTILALVRSPLDPVAIYIAYADLAGFEPTRQGFAPDFTMCSRLNGPDIIVAAIISFKMKSIEIVANFVIQIGSATTSSSSFSALWLRIMVCTRIRSSIVTVNVREANITIVSQCFCIY